MRTRSLRIWLLCCLLGIGFSGYAQNKVYYVHSGGSDGSGTGSAGAPFRTVHKALGVAKATDTVRVAVGKYLISDDAGAGELDIPAGVTVQGGFKTEAGSVSDERVSGVGQEVNQTILQGDSTCRIARVAGVLEGVTVAGGMASRRNGGGVYVETGGVVSNCIIHSNRATGLVPKVGDLLMKDGSFMVSEEFTADLIGQLEGVVFWVNPVKNAPAGQQGKAVHLRKVMGAWADKKTGLDAAFNGRKRTLVEEALEDVDGEVNTDFFFTRSGFEFELAEQCRALGGVWYMPASGELMQMLVEWASVSNSQENVWNQLSATQRNQYFGNSTLTGWRTPGPRVSSTFVGSKASTLQCWQLNDFCNDTQLQEVNLFPFGNYPDDGLETFPVRKF